MSIVHTANKYCRKQRLVSIKVLKTPGTLHVGSIWPGQNGEKQSQKKLSPPPKNCPLSASKTKLSPPKIVLSPKQKMKPCPTPVRMFPECQINCSRPIESPISVISLFPELIFSHLRSPSGCGGTRTSKGSQIGACAATTLEQKMVKIRFPKNVFFDKTNISCITPLCKHWAASPATGTT